MAVLLYVLRTTEERSGHRSNVSVNESWVAFASGQLRMKNKKKFRSPNKPTQEQILNWEAARVKGTPVLWCDHCLPFHRCCISQYRPGIYRPLCSATTNHVHIYPILLISRKTEQRQTWIQHEEHRRHLRSLLLSSVSACRFADSQIRRFADAGMMPGFELLLVQVEVAAHPQPLFPAGHEMGNLAERGGLVTLSPAVNGLNKSEWSFCATKVGKVRQKWLKRCGRFVTRSLPRTAREGDWSE